jgi:hypothetical protein
VYLSQTTLNHFGDLNEMVFDALAAVEAGCFCPLYHLLEVAVVRIPEDLCEVPAGPALRSGRICTPDLLKWMPFGADGFSSSFIGASCHESLL